MDPQNMSSAVSDASNHLGISLLRCLSKEEKGNVFISPLSLSSALAMLHCAARGQTRQEMRKVFAYDDVQLADEDVAKAFGHLLSAWDKKSQSYVLTCANSIVIDNQFSVKEEYKSLLKESFRASLVEANFATESAKAVQEINRWVNEKTNGMIPQVLDSLSPLTAVVLLNAIYFKGTWLYKFEESLTRIETFYNDGLKENEKKIKMMKQTARFGYAKKKSFAVLQLPYVGENIAMMVLLPEALDGIGELEQQLTPEFFKSLKKELRPTKVKVYLPKFKFEYSESMKGVLQSLGMSSAFKWGADLSGMSSEELGGMNDDTKMMVSDVIHKTVVEVNEEGSEAAAATAMMGRVVYRGARTSEYIPYFIVDHPFLFTIFDTKNDAIIFLGKINVLK